MMAGPDEVKVNVKVKVKEGHKALPLGACYPSVTLKTVGAQS
jgi:hypothetical protein